MQKKKKRFVKSICQDSPLDGKLECLKESNKAANDDMLVTSYWRKTVQ